MDNKEYTKAVEQEHYPSDPTVPIASEFRNENGVIRNLLFTPLRSVAIIESIAGAERSNHYHKLGNHYLYIVSGQVEYSERNINGTDIIRKVYGPGEMIFSGPQRIHRTISLTDSVMISMSNFSKEHDDHEADLVRMKF